MKFNNMDKVLLSINSDDLDDIIAHPLEERVLELCILISDNEMCAENVSEKIIEEFQKYLIKHKVEA